MTVTELQTKRDQLLKALGIARVQFGERQVEYVTDKERELRLVDSEIARLQSPNDRVFTVQTKRGFEL